MNDMFYVSRSFVEFGPFSAAEVHNFLQRGTLKDTDYVRQTSGDDWIHVNDWAASAPAPAAAAAPAAEAPAKPAKKTAAPKAKVAAAAAPDAGKPAKKAKK